MNYIQGENISVTATLGSTIFTAIAACIDMADKYNCVVKLKFNDKVIEVSKNDNVNEKAKEYFN